MKQLENIFSHAIALTFNSRLKNEIYCYENNIYIKNYDTTVTLRFKSPKKFEEPIGFYANDYESPKFWKEGDKVVFETKNKTYKRTKSCRFLDPVGVVALFSKFYTDKDKKTIVASITSEITPLIDKELGHVEFTWKDGVTRFVQRDLFTGNIIEVDMVKKGFSLLTDNVKVEEFKPIAMRTGDFLALFSFCDKLQVYLDTKGFFLVEGNMYEMEGVVGGCLYDELGIVNNLVPEEETVKDEKQEEVEKAYGREVTQNRKCVTPTCGKSNEATDGKTKRRGRFLRQQKEVA